MTDPASGRFVAGPELYDGRQSYGDRGGILTEQLSPTAVTYRRSEVVGHFIGP